MIIYLISFLPMLVAESNGSVQTTIAIISLIAGVIVYLFQRIQNRNNRFNQCTSSLQTGTEEAQITSAILLRSFLGFPSYKNDALNLIIALLRVTSYGNLQKTLSDGFSYVSHADGKDFQGVKLHMACIKSRRQIKYDPCCRRTCNKRQN